MNVPPETAVHHLRNVLQAFAQPMREADFEADLCIFFTPAEAAAIVVRIKAALRELERAPTTVLRDCSCGGCEVGPHCYEMDAAALGGQEPEDAA